MPDVYYFSWFLALGTLAISFVLKNSVTSRFGFGWLRKIVSDFAVITGTNKKFFVGSYKSDVKYCLGWNVVCRDIYSKFYKTIRKREIEIIFKLLP